LFGRGIVARWRVVALMSLVSGLVVMLPAAAHGETRPIQIHAVYDAPTCPSGTAVTSIPGAKLAVTIGSSTVHKVLDAHGTAELDVPSTATKARATVTLDGQLLQVAPYSSSTPYSFTDALTLTNKSTFKVEPQLSDDRGAASVWTILSQGKALALSSMPAGVTLTKLIARYEPGHGPTGGVDVLGHNTKYDKTDHEILVDSVSYADEFEPWVLLHEYGHYVLDAVADPGPNATGPHSIDQSYRTQPALPWSEGFAHAYAAIVRNNPVLGTACRTGVNLSAHPAVPHSLDGPDLNQYHEASIGGVVWGLASYYGAGNVRAGLGSVLGALHKFHAKYGGPVSASEARDAMTEFGDGHDTGVQQAIGNVFDDQRLRWGFSMQEVSETVHGQGGGWVFPWARGGSCNMSYPYPYPVTSSGEDAFFAGPEGFDQGVYNHGAAPVVDGPLDYTRQDECWETVRGHYLDNTDLYSLIQTMPYQADQAHRNQDTVLGVVFQCVQANNECSGSSRTVTISVGTGVWHRPDGQTYLDSVKPLHPVTLTMTVPPVTRSTLLPSDIVPVAKVDAQGHCKTLVGATQDCGS
jgi:hypothetical protein